MAENTAATLPARIRLHLRTQTTLLASQDLTEEKIRSKYNSSANTTDPTNMKFFNASSTSEKGADKTSDKGVSKSGGSSAEKTGGKTTEQKSNNDNQRRKSSRRSSSGGNLRVSSLMVDMMTGELLDDDDE